MKTITLWQPWASLIADGIKLVETRPRAWYFIGDILIHAGLHVDEEACRQFGYDPATIVRGNIVAIARKFGCVQFPNKIAPPDAYGNFAVGRYGYLLDNVRRLREPIPASGKQGFWEFPIPTACAFSKVTNRPAPF